MKSRTIKPVVLDRCEVDLMDAVSALRKAKLQPHIWREVVEIVDAFNRDVCAVAEGRFVFRGTADSFGGLGSDHDLLVIKSACPENFSRLLSESKIKGWRQVSMAAYASSEEGADKNGGLVARLVKPSPHAS